MRKLIFLTVAVLMTAFLACSEQKHDEQADEHAEHMSAQTAGSDSAVVTYASWNTICPVQSHEVDNTVPTIEYNGKAYGFCCEGCDKKFSENPEKYAKNLSEDGKEFIETEKEG